MASYLLYNKIAEIKNVSISQIEKDLGLSNATIANAIKRKSTVRQTMIDKLSKAYPDIDINKLQMDLLKGGEATSGNDLDISNVNEQDLSSQYNNNQQLSGDKKRVPLFSVNASAGTDEIDLAPVTIATQYIELGDLLKSDSQAALYIFGNSMTPNYPSGCIVGLRQNLDGIIQPGEVYVIETDSNRLLKRLYYNADHSGFECYSDNAMTFENGPKKGAYMYPVFEVLKSQIRRLFDVTGMIKRNSNSAIMLRA